jgi:hypothetical protein
MVAPDSYGAGASRGGDSDRQTIVRRTHAVLGAACRLYTMRAGRSSESSGAAQPLPREDHLGAGDAEPTLTAVPGWGRYVEAFFYDHRTRLFSLAKPWEVPQFPTRDLEASCVADFNRFGNSAMRVDEAQQIILVRGLFEHQLDTEFSRTAGDRRRWGTGD